MIYKKLDLPMADSLRIHYPIRYKNPLGTPVMVILGDNEAEIRAHLRFTPALLRPYENAKGEDPKDSLLKMKPEGFTYADAICEGIKKNWEGTYELPWYSNGSGHKFRVRVNIIRKDDPNAVYEKGQKFAKVQVAPFFAPSSFVMSDFWRWFWGLFYCGSLESFTLNWHPRFPGIINLKRYKTLRWYEQVAAHEFGHLIGIGDAYDAPYRFFYQLEGVSSYMMCYNRHVQSEEIEMVLRAHLTRRMQFFPYKFSLKTFFKGVRDTFKH